MKQGAWHRLKKRGDVKLAIALFGVALLILVWSTVILEARSEREEAIAAAVKQSSNLAVAYEEHVIREGGRNRVEVATDSGRTGC